MLLDDTESLLRLQACLDFDFAALASGLTASASKHGSGHDARYMAASFQNRSRYNAHEPAASTTIDQASLRNRFADGCDPRNMFTSRCIFRAADAQIAAFSYATLVPLEEAQ